MGLGNHMGLGSDDECHVPPDVPRSGWWAVALAIAAVLAASLLIVAAVPVWAGESVAPRRNALPPAESCARGSEQDLLAAGGAAYAPIDALGLERLLTFLVWTRRPPGKADRAWRGDANGHVAVIFVLGACVTGYVVMDEPTFSAVVEARPLPKLKPPPRPAPSALVKPSRRIDL